MHAKSKQHNKDERHSCLEKIYLSLYLKGLCVRGSWRPNKLQHIDPQFIGHNHVSFPSSWAAQPGTWGPSLSGTSSHSSIFSPTGLISKLINRGPEGSLCWVLAFFTAFVSNWSGLQTDWISCALSYIIVQCPPVIYTGAYSILTARPGRRSIYNTVYDIKIVRLQSWSLQTVKYSFIALTPMFTLTHGGRTCEDLTYESNITVQYFAKNYYN